jgi:RNA polymerase sigma-70 factor (ECF subfamily)
MYDSETTGRSTTKKTDFISLLTSNSSRINSFIYCMVPNESDAEDIMQDTTITMWEKFESYRYGTDFAAWAVTVAKYKILEYRRKGRMKHLQLDEHVLELLEKENPHLFDDTEQRTRALRQCLQKLPHADLDFIKLKYSQGLTAKKLSHRIGISLAAVYRINARLNALLLGCIDRTLMSG